MRRDGDRLFDHVARAGQHVLLVSPFVKVKVIQTLLDSISAGVAVKIVTRWRPEEVAAGVSDLEVFDVVMARPGASLWLLDRLHAKLYVADDVPLVGSANLTATALGWCDDPNVEILTEVPTNAAAVKQCLVELGSAREATVGERDKIRLEANRLKAFAMPIGRDADEGSRGLWVPSLAAPSSLYRAYVPRGRERLVAAILEAADRDLAVFNLPTGLGEAKFNEAVAQLLREMPAVGRVIEAAASHLTDADAIALLGKMNVATSMPLNDQWNVLREWMTHFLGYEIAPQSFVTRPKAGTLR